MGRTLVVIEGLAGLALVATLAGALGCGSSDPASSQTPGADADAGDGPPSSGDAGAGPGASDAAVGAPGTLCIGGEVYDLASHDEFDQDTSLSVSDTWPTPPGTKWTNRFQYGRTNNPGTDDAYYPSKETVAAWGAPPVAELAPGVGVKLTSYLVPQAHANDPILCEGGACRKHLAGLLSSSEAHATGFWVYSVQTPGGPGWWPAAWLLNQTTMGEYNEIDNLEQWGPATFGPNVVVQTRQLPMNSPNVKLTIASASSAQHTYAAIVTDSFTGFYIDGVPSSKRLARGPTTPMSPIMNLQSCIAGWCAPGPDPSGTGTMIVRYYRYYAPTSTAKTCAPPFDLPALAAN